MFRTIKKAAAALFAGLTLNFLTLFPVSAEKGNEAYTLPSDKTVKELIFDIEAKAANLGGDDPSFASAAIGIFKGDEILYTGYFGETDIKNHIASNEDSVYEWGSISKTLIWVSVMQLWEEGKIDLERDVRDYLPEGFFQHLSYGDPITMLNLMDHNAGWQEMVRPLYKTDEADILPLKEELQAAEPAQIHRPGEVSAYSNYGAAVAGYIVECITGQDFCEYVHEHIFEPLGMEHTSLNPAHSDNTWVYENRKLTRAYKSVFGTLADLGQTLKYVGCYPAGAAAGTLSDLMIYAQALADKDAPLFNSPETQKLMFTGTDFYGSSDIPICCHGFWCNEYAVRTYGHNGGTAAGQSDMEFDIDSGLGIVIMVNEPDGNELISMIPNEVFGTLTPERLDSLGIRLSNKISLSGYYLPARSTFSGLTKLSPYISATPGKSFSEVYDAGNGVYVADIYGNYTLINAKKLPGGETALGVTSMDLIHDDMYFLKLCLLTVYILSAVGAFYLLRIRRKLRKHGKPVSYSGSSFTAAAHWARISSFIALISTYIVSTNSKGGIPYNAGAVIGSVQIICAAVLAVSAAVSAVSLVKEKKHLFRYSANAVFSILSIAAVAYFEMYKFWSI